MTGMNCEKKLHLIPLRLMIPRRSRRTVGDCSYRLCKRPCPALPSYSDKLAIRLIFDSDAWGQLPRLQREDNDNLEDGLCMAN